MVTKNSIMASYLCLGFGVISALLWHIVLDSNLLIAFSLSCIIVFYGLRYSGKEILPLQKKCMLLLLLCSSYSYTTWRINLTNSQLITEAIPQIMINGYITTPPVIAQEQSKSEFKITSGRLKDLTVLLYSPKSTVLKPGINYTVTAGLQAIAISKNISSFDYQQYLINNHIAGFAYLKQIDANNGNTYAPQAIISKARVAIIDYLSQTLKNKDYMGMTIALICGYQSLIPDSQWQVFKNSGIIHIVSISGLHITLAAGLAMLIANFLLRYFPVSTIPRQLIVIWIGVIAALAYSLLAGFSIPTQRTFYLLLISAYLFSQRMYIPLLQKLAITGCLVLIIDPFAGLSSSFWLSFGLVATIFSISQTYQRYQSKLKFWFTLQLAMTLVSLPISLYLFNAYPLISIIANLWAVPIIGTLITPALLVAALLHFNWLLQLLTDFLKLSMQPITMLAAVKPYGQMTPDLVTILLCYIGLFILFMPKSLPYKNIIGFGLFCCLFAIPNKSGSYGHMEITTFSNAKAGVSLISTQTKSILVYIPYSTSNDPAKSLNQTLVPYLKAHSINKIDYLVSNAKIESLLYHVFEDNQIELQNASLTDGITTFDGIFFETKHLSQNIAIRISDINNQANYIGNGYNEFTQTNWKSATILAYPWANPEWLYNTKTGTLILSYPNKAKNKVSSIKNNLSLNTDKIHDTKEDGSLTIN